MAVQRGDRTGNRAWLVSAGRRVRIDVPGPERAVVSSSARVSWITSGPQRGPRLHGQVAVVSDAPTAARYSRPSTVARIGRPQPVTLRVPLASAGANLWSPLVLWASLASYRIALTPGSCPGGGSVGDVAGFVAATTFGASASAVPTTLLGWPRVDRWKTAIDIAARQESGRRVPLAGRGLSPISPSSRRFRRVSSRPASPR